MVELPRKPKVFFAIPCGDFYSIQARIIANVTDAAGVKAIIVEDHAQTEGLWGKIAEQIDSADLFVADISSRSPNIALELGYAMREKLQNIGIFASFNASVPVDLQGFVLQKYMSFADFQRKLICWLCQSVNLDPARLEGLEPEPVSFRDDFKDQDAFLRRWSWPPDSWHVLAPEGLRLAHSTFPILTKTLGLLRDCEFRFRTRIEREAVGWVIKGTVPPGHLIPAFCVMFNLSDSGRLRVHILNEQRIASNSLYQIIKTQSVEIEKSTDGWLNLITKTRGDIIEVSNEGRVIFGGDFSKEPYVSCYGFPDKQGQVGFRCCGSEEATVNFVEVTELSTVDLAVT